MSTPDYYQFPYGIEPILISRHLTSNDGQILQYVARSTRLDGKNKHGIDGRISDLNKLINLAYDEISRLEEEAEGYFDGLPSVEETFGATVAAPDKPATAVGYTETPYVADPLEDELWEEYFCGRKFRRLDDENALRKKPLI